RVTGRENCHTVAAPFELLGEQRNDDLDAAIRRRRNRVPRRRDEGDVHCPTTYLSSVCLAAIPATGRSSISSWVEISDRVASLCLRVFGRTHGRCRRGRRSSSR